MTDQETKKPRSVTVETRQASHPEGLLGPMEPPAYVVRFNGEEVAECWDDDVARVIADALEQRVSDDELLFYDSDGEGLEFGEFDE